MSKRSLYDEIYNDFSNGRFHDSQMKALTLDRSEMQMLILYLQDDLNQPEVAIRFMLHYICENHDKVKL